MVNEWISEDKEELNIRLKGGEDYRKRKMSVLLQLVLYMLSVRHLWNFPVEKSSKQVGIRFEAQPNGQDWRCISRGYQYIIHQDWKICVGGFSEYNDGH